MLVLHQTNLDSYLNAMLMLGGGGEGGRVIISYNEMNLWKCSSA